MNTFWKHTVSCLLRLLLSEILCFVLAFSFAILSAPWMRPVSLVCGVTAHCLLMWSCAQQLARKDIAAYRVSGKGTGLVTPVLLGLLSMLPQMLVYLLLCLNAQSTLMLNLFPLMQSPYIQIHRLLIGGAECFAEISSAGRILMALPPLLTFVSVFIGYALEYAKASAKIRVQNQDSGISR